MDDELVDGTENALQVTADLPPSNDIVTAEVAASEEVLSPNEEIKPDIEAIVSNLENKFTRHSEKLDIDSVVSNLERKFSNTNISEEVDIQGIVGNLEAKFSSAQINEEIDINSIVAKLEGQYNRPYQAPYGLSEYSKPYNDRTHGYRRGGYQGRNVDRREYRDSRPEREIPPRFQRLLQQKAQRLEAWNNEAYSGQSIFYSQQDLDYLASLPQDQQPELGAGDNVVLTTDEEPKPEEEPESVETPPPSTTPAMSLIPESKRSGKRYSSNRRRVHEERADAAKGRRDMDDATKERNSDGDKVGPGQAGKDDGALILKLLQRQTNSSSEHVSSTSPAGTVAELEQQWMQEEADKSEKFERSKTTKDVKEEKKEEKKVDEREREEARDRRGYRRDDGGKEGRKEYWREDRRDRKRDEGEYRKEEREDKRDGGYRRDYRREDRWDDREYDRERRDRDYRKEGTRDAERDHGERRENRREEKKEPKRDDNFSRKGRYDDERRDHRERRNIDTEYDYRRDRHYKSYQDEKRDSRYYDYYDENYEGRKGGRLAEERRKTERRKADDDEEARSNKRLQENQAKAEERRVKDEQRQEERRIRESERKANELERRNEDIAKEAAQKKIRKEEAIAAEKKAEEAKREAEENAEKNRIAAEEEKARLLAEAERIMAEEKAKAVEQEQKEKQRREDEEKKSLMEFSDEVLDRNAIKMELRETNNSATDNRPDEAFFSKLDSSLKKNTAFVKKLKTFTESQKDSLIKEFNGLNLTKYVGEVAGALTEAKLKMSDIPSVLQLTSVIHRRYGDFANLMLESWQKAMPCKKDDKVANASKLRVDLRYFADLVAVGIFGQKVGLHHLANQLTFLTQNDKEEHNNLTIITSFARHCGDDYAGLLPRKYRLLAEKYDVTLPRSTVLPPERQRACCQLLKEYYASLRQYVLLQHGQLKQVEKTNRSIMENKGEVHADRLAMQETLKSAFEKLWNNTCLFADLLDEDEPELPQDKEEMGNVMSLDLVLPGDYYDGDAQLFEDEDTRTFYENVKDLRAFIPAILYKDSENEGKAKKEEDSLDKEEIELEDVEKLLQVEKKKMDAEEAKKAEQRAKASAQALKKKGGKGIDSDALDDFLEEEELVMPEIEEDDNELTNMRAIVEAFLNGLPNCVNRDMIDQAATDFCTNMNTKQNRRKLVKTMFTVHRTRYDLLPFYSRLVATLMPCMPDVASDLVEWLKKDLRFHLRKKDQINIESKMKTARFIGELVKFNVFPRADALHCLKLLLADFTYHNIEMACALLETCGRFLYRTLDSHNRTKVYLEVMLRKKTAMHMDQRYQTLIENAYYYSNPPESKPREQREQRPPQHEYIRKLLYKDLSKISVERVLRQMRKMDWDDPQVKSYACRCLYSAWKIRFNTIHCLANVISGLAPYHEDVAVQVVDAVMEDIRFGMEVNHPKYNQRRVSCVKFLAELYNYRVVESAVIFKTFYAFITFGVSYDENVVSALDPPEHLFRVRLVCVLLETCGQYFDRGSSKKKLDCFLTYFQRYYWMKRSHPCWTEDCPFPVNVIYMVTEALEAVRPKLTQAVEYEGAKKAADELDAEFREKYQKVIEKEVVEEAEDAEESLDFSNLEPIAEGEDEYDEGQLPPADYDATFTGTYDSDLGVESQGQISSQDKSLSQSASKDVQDISVQEGGEECEFEDDADLSAAEEDFVDPLVTDAPKHIKCAEDDDFMAAFDKMMLDTISHRSSESIKAPQPDIAVPLNVKNADKGRVNCDNTINFVVMTKKGNKQHYSTLPVPLNEKFASNVFDSAAAQLQERERVKRVTLNIHERQEEEDYQEMLASLNRPMAFNTNRDKKVKYQHPKGAPDADLIFGHSNRKR